MGSFNVVCSISGLSIHCGDEVIYFPLEKTKYPSHIIGDSNNSLIYPWCIYSPITLPIYGDYGDYGTIDIDRKDPSCLEHVNFLENKTGYKIENIIEVCHYDNDYMKKPVCAREDGLDLKTVGSGMFILREIYDMMTNFCYNDNGAIRNYREQLEKEYQIYQDGIKRSYEHYQDYELGYIDSSSFKLVYHKTMKKLYLETFLTNQFKEEFIKFRIFEWAMFGMNKFYFPAMNGCQFGCTPAEKILLEKSLELVNQRLKKENDNDDGDLDEHALLWMVHYISNLYGTLCHWWTQKRNK